MRLALRSLTGLALLWSLLCALWAPAMAEEAAKPTPEAEAVARSVTANAGWMHDAKQCPVRLMPRAEASDVFSRNDCQPAKLGQCLDQCVTGTPRSCYWLAHALQAQGADDAAEALYQQACKLGVASGCTNRAAGMSKDASGDEPVNVCAAATFDATCAAGDPWGCTMLALHLSRGMGVKPDRQRALQVLGKSCKYGPEDEACVQGQRLRRELEGDKQEGVAKP